MNLERRYAILVHACSAVSIACFALAGLQPLLALVALVALAFEWATVSGPGRRPLPRWVNNIALVVTTIGLVWELTSSPDEFVTVIARYMVWLQLIKHAEPKTPRDQGQLLALTAMLVIASALTNVSVVVGLVLLVYLPLLLATVMHFQIFAGQVRAAKENAAAVRKGPGRPLGLPLAAGPGINRGLFATTSLSGLSILVGAVAVFVLAPRGIGESFLGRISPPTAGSVTGFSDFVQLGGDGVISQSTAVALEMKIRVNGMLKGPPMEFHLRGAVLDEYDPETGTWSRSRFLASFDSPNGRSPSDLIPDNANTYQEVTLYNKQSSHVFTVWRCSAFGMDATARYSYLSNSQDGSVQTSTNGLVRYRAVSGEPAPGDAAPGRRSRRPPPPDNPFLEGPIRDIADGIIRDAGLDETATARERADALQSHLERECLYTLERSVPRAGEDPIVMFLTRTKAGHCEYFASAMTAMARALGMEARIVTGFVASEFDHEKQTYIVRQSNAHAWSEVWIDDRWVTFDPSAREAISAQARPGVLAGLRLWFDRLESLWVRSVVSFDRDNQRQIMEGSRGEETAAFRSVSRLLSRVVPADSSPGEVREARTALATLVLYLFLGLAGIGMFIAGVRRLSRDVGANQARRRRAGRAARGEGAPSAAQKDGRGERARVRQQGFYASMLRTLARRRMPKPGWRPPLAHARSIEPRDPAMSRAAERLSRLYYASRFGGRVLTAAEVEETRELLAALRRASRGKDAAP